MQVQSGRPCAIPAWVLRGGRNPSRQDSTNASGTRAFSELLCPEAVAPKWRFPRPGAPTDRSSFVGWKKTPRFTPIENGYMYSEDALMLQISAIAIAQGPSKQLAVGISG